MLIVNALAKGATTQIVSSGPVLAFRGFVLEPYSHTSMRR